MKKEKPARKQALLIMASETIFGEITISPPLSKEEGEYLSLFLNKLHAEKYENTELLKTLYHVKQPLNKTEKLHDILQIEDAWPSHLIGIKQNDLTPFGVSPLEINGNLDTIKIKKKVSHKDTIGEWLVFLIAHFLKEGSIAKTLYPKEFAFLQIHQLNGKFYLKEKDFFTIKKIEINNNVVFHSYGDYSSHPVYSLHNPNAYKKLHIKDLINYECVISSEILNSPKSDFLDKLLLKVSLQNSLIINEEKQNKIKL